MNNYICVNYGEYMKLYAYLNLYHYYCFISMKLFLGYVITKIKTVIISI